MTFPPCRWAGLLSLALLLTACGDDPVPEVEVPSWAKVAPEQIAEAKKHGVPVAFENDLGMRFVLIPAGTFLMGSPEDEEGRADDETQHEVTITKPYYMSIYEVTNEQFQEFKPEHDPGLLVSYVSSHPLNHAHQPAVRMRLAEIHDFCRWVSTRDPVRAYRLPIEDEWERACRAGTDTAYYFGSDPADLPRYENIGDLSARGLTGWYVACDLDDGRAVTAPVGGFAPNPWGLFDMLGNVEEVCWPAQSTRVLWQAPIGRRGGSWSSGKTSARCARRSLAFTEKMSGSQSVGFRLVSPLPEPGERGR